MDLGTESETASRKLDSKVIDIVEVNIEVGLTRRETRDEDCRGDCSCESPDFQWSLNCTGFDSTSNWAGGGRIRGTERERVRKGRVVFSGESTISAFSQWVLSSEEEPRVH